MSLHTEELNLKRAADAIRQGKLVAFPTETVYGLGANALDADAVRRIYEAKGRPWASPLIVHVADEAMARSIAAEWPSAAGKLAAKYWPGPLTMVLRKADIIPDLVTAGLPTVGIRIPDHPLALALIRTAGVPVAAPSANPFMGISPTTAEHVRESLGDRVDFILDGGPASVGIESTVVSLNRNPPAVLRAGMISREELRSLTGIGFAAEADKPELVQHLGDEAPGQQPRHYSPKTRLVLLKPGEPDPEGRGYKLEMPSDPARFAAALYARLHEADGQGWEWIAIDEPANSSEWEGILDRLRRASSSGS